MPEAMRVCSEEVRGETGFPSFSGDDVSKSDDGVHRLGVLGRDDGREGGGSYSEWARVLLLLFALAFRLLGALFEVMFIGGNCSSSFPSCGVVKAGTMPPDLLPGLLPKLNPLLERGLIKVVGATVAVVVVVLLLPMLLLLEDFEPELLPGRGI